MIYKILTFFLRNNTPEVYAYSNASKELSSFKNNILGFGNSLPDRPLNKVVAGTKLMMDICESHKKINEKTELIDELINLLRRRDR